MSLGDAWSESTPGSASKLNKVTVISGTGTYIVSLDKDDHSLFRTLDSTGGLTANHLYMCSADGLSLIDVTDIDPHVHDSDESGGEFSEILRSNPDIIDSGSLFIMFPDKNRWYTSTDGSATIVNDEDVTSKEWSIKLLTGTTSASEASMTMPSLEVDTSYRSWFKCMQRLSSSSNVAFRVGYGMDNLNETDDDGRKYGVEGCTTVNGNYFVRTATGGSRSASDTGTAFATTRTSLRCEHYPDLGTPKVDTYINEGTVFTKTSNIPTTYLSDDPTPNRIMLWSCKTNTNADKNLFCYGMRFSYKTSNDWN